MENTKNGLPQGSVLSPHVFNLYTNYLLITRSHKFIYTDDICLATQATGLTSLEQALNEDFVKTAAILQNLGAYNQAQQKQSLVYSTYEIQKPLNKWTSKWLDISLSMLPAQLTSDSGYDARNTSEELRTPETTSKLAGTKWGAAATTLCTSALALSFSAGEYCVPVWSTSSHTHHVDTQQNTTK